MKKVLVIDDSPEVAQVVGAILRSRGFISLIALDGEAGIELARKELPDLIICDVHMPRLDGYQTLKALRENESTSTTPFVFLSGIADRPNVRLGMELGADDYLAKPFTAEELMAAVRTRLAKKEHFEREAEKRLNEMRGNITLALPHELRTPLSGILGLCSILIDEYATIGPDQILETAKYIEQSAQRLHRVVENFLIYAQLELLGADSEDLRRTAAASATLVETLVLETARQMAGEAGREADLRMETVACTVPVIGENLKKIAEELLSNAFKFSPPGAVVLVQTRVTDGKFELSVTDHGRGMTAEQIARVGPHIQFDRRIHEQQGSGLGLTIARRLTELQGGQWSIESVPGRQTTVRVTFPCSATPAAAGRPHAGPDPDPVLSELVASSPA